MMSDLLDIILRTSAGTGDEARLQHAVAEYEERVFAAAGGGNRMLVAEAEDAVQRDPGGAFEFDNDGFARLRAAGHTWHAGRFETVRLDELRDRVVRR